MLADGICSLLCPCSFFCCWGAPAACSVLPPTKTLALQEGEVGPSLPGTHSSPASVPAAPRPALLPALLLLRHLQPPHLAFMGSRCKTSLCSTPSATPTTPPCSPPGPYLPLVLDTDPHMSPCSGIWRTPGLPHLLLPCKGISPQRGDRDIVLAALPMQKAPPAQRGTAWGSPDNPLQHPEGRADFSFVRQGLDESLEAQQSPRAGCPANEF